jgi:hypothetical protein
MQILIFNNLAERENESLKERITVVANSVGVKLENYDFSDLFRVGKLDPAITKPRPVLVKFTRLRPRRDIYGSRLRLKEGDVQIFVSEDLIPDTSKLAYETRQFCKSHQLTTWTQNCIIQYKKKGSNDKP